MADPGNQKPLITYLLLIYCLSSVASGVGPNEVIVWREGDFSGDYWSFTLDPEMRHLLVRFLGGWYTNGISSIEIGSNVKLAVYRERYFGGQSRVFENSVRHVSDHWKMPIDSIIVFPRAQADPLGVVLRDLAFNTITGTGNAPAMQFFPLAESIHDDEALYPAVGGYINDKAGYVLLQGADIEAELFKDLDFEPGYSLVLPKDPSLATQAVCSANAESEFNGYRVFRLSGCILNLEGEVSSLKVRWIGPKEKSPSMGTSEGGFIPEVAGGQTETAATWPSGGAPQIVDVSWQPKKEVILVTFDRFPAELWNERWEMYIDDDKMPVVAPQGSPNIRPDAELDNHPSGVFIGSLPWPSSLAATDFPCCGTIRFCIPGAGCTNEANYDLSGEGCSTMSQKNCNSPSSSPGAGS